MDDHNRNPLGSAGNGCQLLDIHLVAKDVVAGSVIDILPANVKVGPGVGGLCEGRAALVGGCHLSECLIADHGIDLLVHGSGEGDAQEQGGRGSNFEEEIHDDGVGVFRRTRETRG